MTNTKLFILFILSLFAIYSCNSDTQKNTKEEKNNKTVLKLLWASDPALQVPESVCYDPENEVLYVSNINGQPSNKDGSGYISVLSLKGDITELNWIDGLDAPKGMAVYNGLLYVTNIDEVVKYGIDSGAVIERYACPGATFANDIAISEDGTVYISGMGTNQIYRLIEEEVEVWIPDGKFERPNGLFAEKDYLVIGTKDAIFKADYETGTVTKFIDKTNSIDGLKAFGKDRYIISDWSGQVNIAGKDSDMVLLLNTTEEKINAADFEYIPEKQLVLIPTFFDNRVMAYEIK